MPSKRQSGDGPIVIKKYANRRLYNTATSSYVTLDHLAEMVKDGDEFIVHDAKSGEDITRSVLTQIIFEEESKGGQQLLPLQFLRQLIRFYGDQMQGLVPGYLEMSMENFARNQEAFRNRFAEAVGDATGVKELEELTRQNFALFDRAVRMFMPFSPQRREDAAPQPEAPSHGLNAEDQIAELKQQIEDMRRQLQELSRK